MGKSNKEKDKMLYNSGDKVYIIDTVFARTVDCMINGSQT